jgi:hypothetical protein
MQAGDARLGYVVSRGIYLPESVAGGTKIHIESGVVTAYAGQPDAPSHRPIATIYPGEAYTISGLFAGEVVSFQSGSDFTYRISGSDPAPSDPEPPAPGEVVHSIPAVWRCDTPNCEYENWYGNVITWPSWSAYQNNNRPGESSRTVYSFDGDLLYPYMGSWANGCQVTVHSGLMLVIEWERGTNVWRETLVYPGQTHIINLVGSENGAMLETSDAYNQPFSVSMNNCTPQPVPK